MLSGICDPEDDDADAFADKVKYSIIWKCQDALRDVLRETRLNSDKKAKKAVLQDALIDAIARNNVPALKVLFEDECASLDQFDEKQPPPKYKEWFDLLLTRMKRSWSQPYVDVLMTKVKKQLLQEDRLLLLEGLYKSLLGKKFVYRIGDMGPEVDLFFLQVLYNRMEMAEVFWLRSKYPVAMAISAAYLLRELAKSDGLLPDARMLMLENASLFEKKAVGVMNIAQKTDQQLATLILDLGLRLWMETKMLDLAVQSNCRDFVRECCREAINVRMYGDIDPYQNSFWWIWFNVFPFCGLWAAISPRAGKVFLKLEGWAIKFKMPPENEVVRNSTQRRSNPPPPGAGRQSLERFVLFWKAPIVIFIFNAYVALAVTIIFTEYFIRKQQLKLPVLWQDIVIMVYCKKNAPKRPAMFQPPCSPASLSKLLAELTCDAVCRHLCAHSRDLAVSFPGRQCGLFESSGGSEEEGPRIFYGLLEYHGLGFGDLLLLWLLCTPRSIVLAPSRLLPKKQLLGPGGRVRDLF
jgi:hypothetical protein